MAGPIRISILADGSRARREFATTQAAASRLGSGLKGFAVASGLAIGVTGLVALGKAAIGTEAAFSQSMNLIQAATKASGSEIKQMNDLAIKLGADTSFSAGEAADAMLELAKAGLSTKTIMKGGLSGTLTLAAAGGTDLATAATIASNALNTFALKGSDMAMVAAALAGGANASSASVESLGQALQQVGPGATNAGLSLQETVAALSAFDAAGIKGSDAGTSLKTMLTRLVPQTEKTRTAFADLGLDFTKADGSFKSLTQVSQILQDKLSGLTAEQRAVALNTVFGSDATRAATVLFKQGADGIQKYIKATSDQGAAQRLAEARMKGTAGAVERLKGSLETAALVLGQSLAPTVQSVANGLADKLVPGMQAVIGGAKALGEAVAPAVTAVVDLLKDLIPSGEGAGSVFNDVLLPAVRAFSDLVAKVVGVIDALPQGVKNIAVQAGIAALVLPRLTATVIGAGTAFAVAGTRAVGFVQGITTASTRAATASAAMTRLGGAAKTAAGIGGLVALSAGASTTNESLKFLSKAAGGALLGFSLGGPIGGAIGAGAGALYGLASATSSSAVEMAEAEDKAAAYGDTLDDMTGAVTRATRARVFDTLMADKNTATQVNAAIKLGVSSRDIVAAALGQKGAYQRLQEALSGADKKYEGLNDQSTKQGEALRVNKGLLKALLPSLNTETQRLAASTKAAREKAAASLKWGEALRGVPKKVQTAIKQQGYDLSRRQVLDLVEKYKLTPNVKQTIFKALGLDQARGQAARAREAYTSLPRQIQTEIKSIGGGESVERLRELNDQYELTPRKLRLLIQATGTNATVKDVTGVRDALEDVGKARPNLNPFIASIRAGVKTSRDAGTQGSQDLRRGLEAGPRQAKADLNPFIANLRAGLSGAQGAASSGGVGIGAALKSGVISGFGGAAQALANAAGSAVRSAVAAGRAAGQVKSPSRKMMKLGRDLSDGLVLGLRKGKGKQKKAGRDAVRKLLDGVKGGSAGVEKSLGKITKLVEKSIKLKNDKKEAAREKEVLKNLEKRYEALKRNGKAQDKLNEKLRAQRDRLKGLVEESNNYAASVRDSAVSYASVTNLDTAFNADAIIVKLQARLEKIKQFAAIMRDLIKGGLNQAQVDQLAQGGVEGGLATALAIQQGGAGAISELNSLQTQINAAATGLGTSTANDMYAAGIRAAEGLVKGLESREKDLDRVARRLGAAMVTAVKNQLGIKSPSSVFRGLGEQTVKGLAIGLDETYVRRQGAQLAGALTKGYGSPELTATAAYASTSTAAAGGNTYHLTVNAPVGSSPADIGKTMVSYLDAYERSGGRRRAL